MTSSFAEGAVRVTAPVSYDAEPVAEGGTRRLPGEPGYDATLVTDTIVDALADSDLVLLTRVDLTPRATRDLADHDGPAGDDGAGTVTFDVDVAADEDAVVLMERDGLYSWHLPTPTPVATRALEPGPRTVTFEVAVRPGEPGRSSVTDDRTRGLLGSLVQGAAQALVFRYAAPLLLQGAVAAMEAHVRTGLVRLATPDVGTWRPVRALADLRLPTDRPARVLLFVHGTFSSTANAFGALGRGENGPGFLRAAIAAYDVVLGYDHRTLSLDPEENARDLLHRLRGHDGELVVDVVTHSRGGLTTRSFVEEVLPGSGRPISVDRIVFVAATNAGTHLADPERWRDLVDLHTNLAAASARVVARLPAEAPVSTVVSGVVRGIGAFVKYLVSYAAEGDVVPGLEAMVPGGAFVTRLNRTQPGQPGPGTRWYVVSSDFHVTLGAGSHRPEEFPRELVARLAEGFVDQLFEGPNDLVVDVASMGAIDLAVGGFVAGGESLGTNDRVYHTNYFTQLDVITAIAGWLPLGLGAGGGDVAPLEGAPTAPTGPRTGHPAARIESQDVPGEEPRAPTPPSRALWVESHAAAEPPPEAPPPTTPAPAPSGPGPAPQKASAHLAAEMSRSVVAATPFTVRVRLSRHEIDTTAEAVHEERALLMDAGNPLEVRVTGKTNVDVVGSDTDVVQLPPGGGVNELPFTLTAREAGPVRVLVVVRQGASVLARITLRATAVATEGESRPVEVVTAETTTGVEAPELDGLPWLMVVERELADDRVVYQYDVRLDPEQPPQRFESRPVDHRVEVVGRVLDAVADTWRDTDADPAERQRALQDLGTRLLEELVPTEMQALLWQHRDRIQDLLLYADEPYVPWELVHLKPPDGPRREQPRFLAQAGLVRWQLGGLPERELRVRPGRVRALVPTYKDPRFTLPEAALERTFLVDRLGAEQVTATPAGVRRLLRSGAFDLLHFTGHGAADPADILDAKLLLQGRKRGGTVEPQYLAATAVSENAAWAEGGAPGPVVVLNACQVGQAGELLSTVGGFARAFLDAGASAFVSCLWSVRDQPSRIFVETLYEQLLAGVPMGRASAAAREAARSAGDATWLSFVVYSRPDAVLARD